MGNSCEGRSPLLVKNWAKVSAHTYRNLITDEFIDEYSIQYQSEQQMAVASKILMKRGSISHSNVIKLIYFNDNNDKNHCKVRTFAHRVFLDHYQKHLAQIMDSSQSKNIAQCLCCPIVNGLTFLAQKYGPFLVKESMIFVCNRSGWKKGTSQTAKVWINSHLEESEPEIICSEEEMCQKMAIVFRRISEHRLCSNPHLLQLGRFNSIQQQRDFIFQTHHFHPDKPRKKMLSTFTYASQPQLKNLQNVHASSQTSLPVVNRSFSIYAKETAASGRQAPIQQQPNVPQTANFSKKKLSYAVSPQLQSKQLQKGISQQNLSYRASPLKVNFVFASSPQNSSRKQDGGFFIGNSKPPRPQPITQFKALKAEINQKMVSINANNQVHQKPVEIVQQDLDLARDQQLMKELQEIALSQKSVSKQGAQSKQQEQIPLQTTKQLPLMHQLTLHVTEQFQNPDLNIDKLPTRPSVGEAQERADVHSNQYVSEQPQMMDQHLPVFGYSNQLQSSNTPREQQVSQVQRISFREKQESMPSAHQKEQLTSSVRQKEQSMPSSHRKKQPQRLTDNNKQPQFEDYAGDPYQNLDTKYKKYLKKFNMVVVEPKNTTLSKTYSQKHKVQPYLQKQNSQLDKLHKTDSYSSYPSKEDKTESFKKEWTLSQEQNSNSQLEIMMGKKAKQTGRGELQSISGVSQSSANSGKTEVKERMYNTTERQMRQNRKKIEKLQLQKDLQHEKEIIKKQMESLLKNNLMADESHRIKEKVNYKKATFAQLKAEASKILDDLNF